MNVKFCFLSSILGRKDWLDLILTRGSFCRSVWGTAPGLAATSMGLEA